MPVTVNNSLTKNFLSSKEYDEISLKMPEIHHSLIHKTGAGNDFLGWLELPSRMLADSAFWSQSEYIVSEWKKKQLSYIIVIGIGGSYLGAKAIYEALTKPFTSGEHPKLIFAGHHISATYLEELTSFFKDKPFGIIVISKSGTTLEPALAFRILRQLLIEQCGLSEANKRIVAITDPAKGALRQMTDQAGWPSFVIEDDIGGRYSVLSPVGIFPLMFAGIDVKQLLSGAHEMQQLCFNNADVVHNPALQYALLRFLISQTKPIEILATFQPELLFFIEWWKQLFGESDGKQNKGIFPAGAVFTTDLHSMGQYIQEGQRILFETFIVVSNKPGTVVFPYSGSNEDGLDYLAGKKVSEINTLAEKATMLAHYEGGVPVIGIEIPDLTETSIGKLIYFFEFACAAGGYLLNINPFDQPGVEAYKKNMFALMAKPGMEQQTAEILEKIRIFQK